MASNTERYCAAHDEIFAMVDDDRVPGGFCWPHLVGAFNWAATDSFDVGARDELVN
jgi:hypothetical protein